MGIIKSIKLLRKDIWNIVKIANLNIEKMMKSNLSSTDLVALKDKSVA